MKKILICGCSGFIGKNLLNFFAKKKKYEISGQYFKNKPDFKKNIRYIKSDLTKEKNVKQILENIDIVIQAAATTSGVNDIINQPFIHVTNNAVMNSYLLKYSYLNKIEKFIFFSCSVMYPSLDRKIKENDFNLINNIRDEYFGVGWTKVYIEKMCEFYSKICKTKFYVVRHSNVYGPYDKFDLKKSHVIGATISKVLNAKTNSINVWGNGNEKRDFLYIDDLVNFVSLILKDKSKKNFSITNVGSGKLFSINDLIKLVLEISKKKLKINFLKSKPSINSNICLNISKAKKINKWIPQYELSQGLRSTIKWYKQNLKKKN